MVLEILSFVKELTRDVYAAGYFFMENKLTHLKLYDKLREIESLIACGESVSGDSLRECILYSIIGDMQLVRNELKEIKANRYWAAVKFLTGEYEARKLGSMLSTCTTCQQRLEVILCTRTKNNQEFSNLVYNVKESEVGMSGMGEVLVGVPTEVSKSVSVVHDAVRSIPLSITPDRSSGVLPSSFTATDRSGLLPESSIDVNERKSVEIFSQLPSAACLLVSEWARKRLLSVHVTKHLECIGKMWQGWRVDINDVEYDETPKKKPRMIGKGANSVVFAAKYTFGQRTGKVLIPVAVKEIDVDDLSNENEKGDLLREFFLQLSLHSPYIIQTYGICWPPEVPLNHDTANEARYEDVTSEEDRTVRIVMERMTCNLRHALRKKLLRTPEDKIRVLRDICKALSYLHERNIVHRDVKPENVLLSMDRNGIVGVAKLADFGCSRPSYDRRLAKTMSTVSSVRGTTIYTPPEVMENPEKCRTRKSWDVWSYGLVICDVFSRTRSRKSSTIGVMNEWKNGILFERLQQVAASIKDKKLKALAVRCLSANENDRPQICEVEKDLDQCDLESPVNWEVDEMMSPGEIGEGCEKTLKKRNMEKGNQVPVRFEIPTGQEVEDAAFHHGKDGLCVFPAPTAEDSGQWFHTPDSLSEKGQNAEESRRKVKEEYNVPADGQDTVAKVNLGLRYENRSGAQQDIPKSVQLYKKAADEGNTDAKYNLGVCFENGSGVERDVSKAVQLYKEAAHEGSTDAKNNLGVRYENGNGVEPDVSKAVQLYKEAAEGGSTDAKYNLGVCYKKGKGVVQDASKAVELYKEAADGGSTNAKYNLGVCYEKGSGVEGDISKAVQLYKEAVDGENTNAELKLGVCYENGSGVERDATKAVQMYIKAAHGGSTNAKVRLGVCYEKGNGVERDISKAVQLYKEASDGGSMKAKVRLGVFYENGIGVERDDSTAVQLYKEAVDGGNLTAKYNLGVCYDKGNGVERNISKAVQLYKEAIDLGSMEAKVKLGVCYENGTGVERNVPKAVQLYKEAAGRGSIVAKCRLRLLR